MRRWIVIACLAACGGSPKPAPAPPTPPPAPAPACDALHVTIGGTATAADPATLLVSNSSTTAVDEAQAAAGKAAIAACDDDHWPASSIACFAAAKSDGDQVACTAALPPGFADSLRAHVDRAMADLSDVVLLRGKPRPWQDIPADTGVPACDSYLRAFNGYMRCDKIPDDARQAAAAGAQQMGANFARLKDASVTDDVRTQAGEACAAGLEQLKEGAAAMGCTLP